MKKHLLLFFLVLSAFGWSQVVEDFSDGDFTSNPTWTGTDTSFFVNSNHQLQSTSTTAGEAWLALELGRYAVPQGTLQTFLPSNEKEWRFWIRENFSPSANNFTDVWLCADTAALPCATQGYFLRFGTLGSQDAIELYRKDSDGEHLILIGATAAIASSFKVAVKVNRDAEGQWTLSTDYDNVGNYTVEATGSDNTYPVEGYFGFHLHFTSSNAKKFYFDDIYIGPSIIDTTPPELLALEIIDSQHLLLTFNEPLDPSALDPQHYQANTSPDSVYFATTPSQVTLAFTASLPENTNLTLHLSGISDLSGNIMPDATCTFSIYHPGENDVVINEIMADPTPVVGLPEWEYVELFNTTDLTINLKDWSFLIGNTSKTLPAIQIDPQGYLILCKSDAQQELNVYGPTCGFSSFTIANAGATLRLQSPDETECTFRFTLWSLPLS